MHRVNVESGEFVEGDTVVAAVDPEWRRGATQGHSGTHMVHAALRQVLGPNAVQAGSLNRPGYLRFDFNWQGPLSEDQRTQIEEVTNEAVQADFEVHTFTEQLEKAKAMGAMALFGEAYPDEVRVVEIGGPFSLELCGGTHVHNSAQIGPVTILGESSIGSGVRRVEAYVGLDSFRHLAKERALMAGLASSLKVPSEEVPARVANLVERLKAAEKELERARQANARAAATNAAAGAERIGNVRVVAQRMSAGMTAADLRSLVGDIRGKLGSDPAVVALIAEGESDTVPYAVAANPAAQDLGISANDLVKQLAAAVDGRGGGKADLAQGSGKNPAGIDAALDAVRQRRDSAGRLSGLGTAPLPDRPGDPTDPDGTAARHRCGQRPHRRGRQRPRRHPGDPGGDGAPRPYRQAPAPAGRAGRRVRGGRGGRRAAADAGRPHRPVGPGRDRTGRGAGRRVAPTPVRLADERLTTVSAQRSLREAGVRAKEQRAVIDQAAAVAILQGWLDQRAGNVDGGGCSPMVDSVRRGTGRARGGRAAPAQDEPRRPGSGPSAASAGRRFAGRSALGTAHRGRAGAPSSSASRLWHTLFGGGDDYTGPGKHDIMIQVHAGDSTTDDRRDAAQPRRGRHRPGIRQRRARHRGDHLDPAGLLPDRAPRSRPRPRSRGWPIRTTGWASWSSRKDASSTTPPT